MTSSKENERVGAAEPATTPCARRISRLAPFQSVASANDPNAKDHGNRPLHSVAMKLRALNAGKSGSCGFLQTGLGNDVKYENTYRLEPEPDRKMKPGKITRAIQEELDDCLDGRKYNKADMSGLITEITERLKLRVRDIMSRRYKFICHVVVTEKQRQSISAASMCLWDDKADSYASASFENEGLYASAVVYAVYFD